MKVPIKFLLISIFIIIDIAASGVVFSQKITPNPVMTQPQQQPVDTVEFDHNLERMQKHLSLMQTQMNQLAKAKNARERQKLLEEHWHSMQEAMATMGQMWDASGMGHCTSGMLGQDKMMMHESMMSWPHARSCYSRLTPEQQKQHQYMSDHYMLMQHMMMGHMMSHQHWNAPFKTDGK